MGYHTFQVIRYGPIHICVITITIGDMYLKLGLMISVRFNHTYGEEKKDVLNDINHKLREKRKIYYGIRHLYVMSL